MMRILPATWGITMVRVMAGVILVVASYEKFSAGGPFGFVPAVANCGFPAPQVSGVCVPVLELVGGLLLLTGLGARWVAILFVCEFAVNVFILKIPRQPPFGGWDSMRINLMMLATSLAVVLCGPGELALENVLLRRGGVNRRPLTTAHSGS